MIHVDLEKLHRYLPGCNPRCPGCSHRLLSMEESLKQKASFLKNTLPEWADKVLPVFSVKASDRTGYRNKVVLNVQYGNGKWKFGMMHREELIEIPSCPVHASGVNKAIALLTERMPAYNRFPLAFYVQAGKQLTLIVKSKGPVELDWLDKHFLAAFGECGMEGLWIHYNPSAGRRLFEKTPMQLVWGQSWSTDAYGMQYGPRSFQQLIPELYHQSLREACNWLQPDNTTSVADLYSGTGNSLKYWVEAGSEALGIELSGEAVACTAVNVPEAFILRGKCSERIPQADVWAEHQRKGGKRLLLYANPPRTGIEPEVLEWITGPLRPQRIAYLSCSPGTLGKNLRRLSLAGYIVEKLQPYDFFPLTRHMECLALLKNKT